MSVLCRQHKGRCRNPNLTSGVMLVKRWLISAACLSVIALFLLLLADNYFLIFHFLIELFTILTCLMLVTLSLVTLKRHNHGFVNLIGLSLLPVAFLLLLHAITYPGMNLVLSATPDMPAQFWIAANLVHSLGFLLAVIFMQHKIRSGLLFLFYSLLGLGLGAIVWLGWMPSAMLEQGGQTWFKISSEFVFAFVYILAMIILALRRRKENISFFWPLQISLLLLAAASVSFTLLRTFEDQPCTIGHILRFFALVVLFVSLVVESIEKPFDQLFNEMRDQSITDSLTRLYNHRHLVETLNKLPRHNPQQRQAWLFLFDIDSFKQINDTYGHLVGDDILIGVADIIRQKVRRADLSCRHGGDEFAILYDGVSRETALHAAERLRLGISAAVFGKKKISVTISGGLARYMGGDPRRLINRADELLYMAKADGRNRIYSDTPVQPVSVIDKSPPEPT